MKKDEVMEILEHNWTCLKNQAYTDNELDEALEYIIKVLETDVLEKIIADIDEKISHYDHFSSSNTANGLTMAKEIVEKYRESEGMI